MKQVLIAAALVLFAAPAFPKPQLARRKRQTKNSPGAALNSFMKKCRSDAQNACEADSKEKKLAGAAKTSHTKKCVTDAVGS